MFCEDGPFYILYCFPQSLFLSFFAPIDKKIVLALLRNKKLRRKGGAGDEGIGEGGGGPLGREGVEETMKFNPFKIVSFSDHTSGRWVFIVGTGEAEITALVIVSSKSAEL